MRHRAGSWKLACTAECPAGMVTPSRSGTRVFWAIVGGIVALHAAFIAMQWQEAVNPEANSTRMSMRLVSSTARSRDASQDQPAVQTRIHHPGPDRDRAAPTKHSTRTQPVAQVRRFDAVTEFRTAEPQGIAFGLPRIGIPGGSTAARWSAPTSAPPPQPMSPPPTMLMQIQAARAQISEALNRELSAWQAPADGGACAISAQPESRLDCDNDALTLAISPRESALAGLLHAYRSVEPKVLRLSIAVVQGRYQASWN
ncbi:MAG: hypothetical protein JF606_18200 [Burkholderiales bacterium]|nr:hypothetical protein [Burkholderiales bacterium]